MAGLLLALPGARDRRRQRLDALHAIHTRQSVMSMCECPPTRSDVMPLLEAAVRAPNHHLTEPWRFVVLTGQALEDLGEAMGESVRRQHAGAHDLEMKVQVERARPRRAPVIIAVVYVPSDHPRAREVEDRYALGAAIENLLLAAHATGLAAYLRTGAAASAPEVRDFLGLADGEEVASFVYLGRPVGEPRPLSRRTPAAERTTWRGWDAGE
jgi:nitroreductase